MRDTDDSMIENMKNETGKRRKSNDSIDWKLMIGRPLPVAAHSGGLLRSQWCPSGDRRDFNFTRKREWCDRVRTCQLAVMMLSHISSSAVIAILPCELIDFCSCFGQLVNWIIVKQSFALHIKQYMYMYSTYKNTHAMSTVTCSSVFFGNQVVDSADMTIMLILYSQPFWSINSMAALFAAARHMIINSVQMLN